MRKSFIALAVSAVLIGGGHSLPIRGEGDGLLSICFTGDVLLDRGVRPVAERRGLDYIFSQVEPYFRSADAVVINLECPLTDTLSPVHKKYIFRADSRWAQDLRRVGITHAALANNHTNDQGRRGLQSTVRHLCRAGITPLGYGTCTEEQLSPVLIDKDNQHVALFNALMMPLENWHHTEGLPGVCQPSPSLLVEAVQHYHSSAPETRIVVVLHWGTEFQIHPSMSQRRLAAALSQAGADAIIGHHPHVLQPVDTIGHTLVFYSLGNFVFDQHPPATRRTMMVRLGFRHGSPVAYEAVPLQIEQNRPVSLTKCNLNAEKVGR